MTKPQQQFLELLRSGLWGKPADASIFQGEIDWKTILRLAKEQTVQVLVANGIETLPKELWPPKVVIFKLMEIKTKTASDIKMASTQSIAATKKDIETLIVGKMTGEAVKKTLSSSDFIKDLIKAVAEKFTTDGPVDLNLVLPESLKNDLEPFATQELAKILGAGVEASFSKKIAGGFQIGPKDGGYFVSFTEETFSQLISEYLRPATKKLLFG